MESFIHPEPLESLDQRTLLTDLDNTIWPWIRFASRAYPAIVDTIVEQTEVNEEKVVTAMRRHYTDAGTLEDAGLIAGLKAQGLFKDVSHFNEEDLVREVRQIFSDIRSQYLELYDGIEEMLSIIAANRIRIIGLTDAPPFHAKMRARKLGLERWVKTIFALKPLKEPVLSETVLMREAKGLYETPFTVIPMEEEKPDTNLPLVLGISGEDPDDVTHYIENKLYILGDSTAKDMVTAHRNNAHGILAQWGEARPEEIEAMRRIAPQAITNKNSSTRVDIEEIKRNPKIRIAETPAEVAKIMELDNI